VRRKTRGGESALAQARFHFAERLHHVAVEEHSALATNFGKVPHWLKDPGFIICRHDGDENRVVPNRAAEFLRIDTSVFVHGQKSDLERSPAGEMLEGVQDGVMLCAGADQMPPAIRMRPSEAEHGQIVRFRPAARENQLVRLHSKQLSQGIARVVHAGPRFPSGRMNARRIPIMPGKKRLHCFPGRRAQRCGRVIIEVNHSYAVKSAAPARRFGMIWSCFSS
jgi:hypothetical protein